MSIFFMPKPIPFSDGMGVSLGAYFFCRGLPWETGLPMFARQYHACYVVT